MRRINNNRHKKLVKTLQDLEKIVSDQPYPTLRKDGEQLSEAINLLIHTHNRYEALHQQLSSMSENYHRLYKRLSTQLLAPTLRTLKKELEDDSPYYFLFREILQESKSL